MRLILQVWTDMALEQSINLESNTTVGIIDISQRPRVLECWFLTCHERAAITTAIPCCCTLMCEIKQYYSEGHVCFTILRPVGTHREAAPRWMLRDDDDVRKLLTVITSGLMTDPFSLDEDDDDEISHLIKIATDVRMPFALTERVFSSFEIGTARSDNKVCGTETEYQQHNVLGFPPKYEDQDIGFTSQQENGETGL